MRKKKALSESYLPSITSSQGSGPKITIKSGIPKARFQRFAELVGVQTKLLIEKKTIWGHPLQNELSKDRYRRITHTGINEDWSISKLEIVLETQSEKLSRLICCTLRDYDNYIFQARYSPNQQCETVIRPSSLALALRRLPWMPQIGGEFVVPSKASRALLPTGFLSNNEDVEWLKVVEFGKEELEKSEGYIKRQSAIRGLGFADEEALRLGQWFAALAPEARQRIKENVEGEQQFKLPESTPRNSEQRAVRIAEQAANAPERRTDIRPRSVFVNQQDVKQETRAYLLHQYTNSDGEMICQACKTFLPFKLDDGSYYFETVEFLAVRNNLNGLRNHHYQNYLALCPNHSAMFQYANGAPELMRDMFLGLEGDKLEVVLGQKNTAVYFTQTHINDLKKVIEVDGNWNKERDKTNE